MATAGTDRGSTVKPVAVIVGTRPEAVKLAPVIHALESTRTLRPLVVSTGQHAQLASQILATFGIRVDHDLRVMRRAQSLSHLSSRLAERLGNFFGRVTVDAALVQGDTTTALFGGLCAFYHHVPVGHVEAGLRTGNARSPFPEEINRRLLASLARWHFAPTPETAQRLRHENVPKTSIYVTGNTVVDALRWMASRCDDSFAQQLLRRNSGRRLVLVTCHRRENLAQLGGIAKGLAAIAANHPECVLLLPLHPNPHIRAILRPVLSKLANVVLCRPLPYDKFVACLQVATLVLSDSGGVQEEATALGKPVLVLRDHTERSEGVAAGALRLVGTSPARIVREAARLLRDRAAYSRMARASDVFGDGRAAQRIVATLERTLPLDKP